MPHSDTCRKRLTAVRKILSVRTRSYGRAMYIHGVLELPAVLRDSGGLWMIAGREPEEDLKETQDEPVPIATEQGVLHEEFWDDRTGKL